MEVLLDLVVPSALNPVGFLPENRRIFSGGKLYRVVFFRPLLVAQLLRELLEKSARYSQPLKGH